MLDTPIMLDNDPVTNAARLVQLGVAESFDLMRKLRARRRGEAVTRIAKGRWNLAKYRKG